MPRQTAKPQRSGFNLVDRVVLRYMDWRARKQKQPMRNTRMRGYLAGKATTREDREIIHRVEMPWLFRNSMYRGIVRDSDTIENRRLATAPIVQLCIGAIQEKIKSTPWAIIETEQKDKKYLSKTAYHERDRQFMRSKAEALDADPSLAKLAAEAAMLLSDPNSQHQTFENLISMIIADDCEVGDGVWVLSFAEGDISYVYDKLADIDKLKLRKGARPQSIQAMDVLQFNKDMDIHGVLKGYWHVPYMSGSGGYANNQIYMTKGEMVWFPNDQRTNRWYGYSETEKARDIIDILLLSMEQEASYFSEGMVSPGALSMEDVSQAEIEEMIDYYVENIKGHPEKIWMLGKKANWTPFTFNYKELQFLERKLWDSKSIASLFNLSLSYVGMAPEETNRATAQVEKVVAEDRGVAPRMKFIEYCINTQLIWPYYSDRISFVWDPVHDLMTKESMFRMAREACGRPVLTLNEARGEIGYDDRPEGDEMLDTSQVANPSQGFGTDPFMDFEKELKKKISNDGAVNIPRSEWLKLYRELKASYGSAIDDILKALKEYQPEIDISSENTKAVNTKALNQSGIIAIITETIRKNGLVQKVVNHIVENVQGDMLTVMHEQSVKLDLGMDTIKEVDAISRLTERRMSYYAEIPDTLSDTVIQTLVDTIDQGKSYHEAIDQLKILREDFTTHRAETIVRTEIGRSRREAKLMFGETYSDVLEKKWVATMSGGLAPHGRRRKSHRAMHGKTVPMNQPFIVDYSLDNPKYPTDMQERYPGESKLGINCSCDLELIKKKS